MTTRGPTRLIKNVGVAQLIMATVYLDYNATTPLDPSVLEAITSTLRDSWGNPSSSYPAGKLIACSCVCSRLECGM